MVDRQSGGWSRAGALKIPGMASDDGAPDGLWKRLGFSNASHGARQIALQYRVPRPQLAAGPVALAVHVTRPSLATVVTAPFLMEMSEGPDGLTLRAIDATRCDSGRLGPRPVR